MNAKVSVFVVCVEATNTSEVFLYKSVLQICCKFAGEHPCEYTVSSFNNLKLDSHLPKRCFICFIESLIKMMENAYFILIKIFKFLSWLFGHAEKTAWLEIWS